MGVAVGSHAPAAAERAKAGPGWAYVGMVLLALLALCLVLLGHVALDRGWFELDRPTAFMLRGFKTAVAFGIGLIGIARYSGRRDAPSLIVGVAFTGMAVLMLARIVLQLIGALYDPNLFETTWRLGWWLRLYLPVVLLVGIALVPPADGARAAIRHDRTFMAIAALLVLVGLVGALHPAFPGRPLEGVLVARPEAGWIVAAYLLVLVIMWRRTDLTGTTEGRWLAFALYVGFLNAALVTPFWHSVGLAAALLDVATHLLMVLVAGTGTILGMVHQARAESALLDALRREVAERARIEGALARQAARLERVNEELGQYAYLASHDLQEPLRMVTNYLQLIERRYDHVLDDDGREFMHFAVDGAVRMKRLTNDLLAYSQVSSQQLSPTLTDAGAAFEAARKNLEVTIAEVGAEVTSDALPSVHMDSVRLGQVFQNLIGNALKFRREGVPPRVHVSAEREGAFWRFTVRDNGIGIEGAYHDKVFGVFQRLHRSDVFPGSGIGLSICRKIVERHGGAIWIQSRPGEGTAFHWTVPIDPEQVRSRPTPEIEDVELTGQVTSLIDRARELL